MSDPKIDFNMKAATWDMEPRRQRMMKDIVAAIAGEIELAPTMDVLDFGCGTGLLALGLRPSVNSVTGVDSSPGMIDVFNAKIKDQGLTNVNARLLDTDKGEALDGRYHLVVSSMALHHIKEIEPLLGQFYDILRPGGYLCIADLDPDDGRFHENNEGVFHFGFDRAELGQAFMMAGFGEIRSRTAAEMVKPLPSGGTRAFTIFLVSGRKSGP